MNFTSCGFAPAWLIEKFQRAYRLFQML
uniref:Uncharacterized protein n=1 Tax=Arundo donax TaxID=35708 RepID=A0A0A9FY05_ARUDO